MSHRLTPKKGLDSHFTCEFIIIHTLKFVQVSAVIIDINNQAAHVKNTSLSTLPVLQTQQNNTTCVPSRSEYSRSRSRSRNLAEWQRLSYSHHCNDSHEFSLAQRKRFMRDKHYQSCHLTQPFHHCPSKMWSFYNRCCYRKAWRRFCRLQIHH